MSMFAEISKDSERENWDWLEKRDVDLAREHGLSRERIRQIRKSLGKDNPNKKKSSFSLEITKNWNSFKNLTNTQISETLKCGYFTVTKNLKKQGLKAIRGKLTKYPIEQINWRLPNPELEKIWKMSFNIAAVYRSKYKKGTSFYKNSDESLDFSAEIEEEKRKSEEFFQKSAEMVKGIDNKRNIH